MALDTSGYKKIRPLRNPLEIFDLKGRVGVIIGGAGKMGQEFAKILSLAGAHVVIADLDEDACKEVARRIGSETGRRLHGLSCDVSNQEQVLHLFDHIDREFMKLDFLISNLMSKPEGYYRAFENYSVETWRRVLDVNLTGTFLCCQEAGRLMRKNKQGSIIITSSIYGLVGSDHRLYENCTSDMNPYGGKERLSSPGVYAASKGGLIAFARYLATLLAPDDIRVNILTPGGVYDGQEGSFHQEYVKRTPLGRMAVWSDCNGAILFLVSDASRYMTGANLVIDGGWTAW
jgi:NAD(P)-dependent dehydrogenase (short-subunit alcohol dehydrogenase family)